MSATAALIDWPLEAEDDTPLALGAGEIAAATGGKASTALP
jgi:UDP-N-acetylmuramoyl-tripeptide--D-alanyl-D-alanine ligase